MLLNLGSSLEFGCNFEFYTLLFYGFKTGFPAQFLKKQQNSRK
jgi:hypothetical protein